MNDRVTMTIDNQRIQGQVVFEAEMQTTEHEWLDTLAVVKVESGLFVTTINRSPVTQPVPKGVAVSAMMNHMQRYMKV
jgi:hypothetical protein